MILENLDSAKHLNINVTYYIHVSESDNNMVTNIKRVQLKNIYNQSEMM